MPSCKFLLMHTANCFFALAEASVKTDGLKYELCIYI